MKYFFILLTLTLVSVVSFGQGAEDSVKAAVNKMFIAMKTGDGAGLKSCFGDSVVFQTIARNSTGGLVVKNEVVSEFIDFVGRQKPGSLDERIIFETIKVDGPLALAWTPYQFYFDGKFSHCGVNSFQLVRLNGEWKIQYIIDTRRKEGCKSE